MARKLRKRSWRQIFLDTLSALGGPEGNLVKKSDLLSKLGWDEHRYRRIKDQLRAEGLVVLGTGQGGKVGLAKAPETKGLTLFISYSHHDEALAKELLKHLDPLRRSGLIQLWHDRKLKAGDDLDVSISHELEKADMVLLLVSIDFLNSQYCYDVELERALERQDAGEAVVVPIILRNCLWHQAPFGRLVALPKDGKAVKSWSDPDEAFANIAEGIRDLAKSRLES